ncbi:MAG: hypothetical protein AVDCRST_MAG65-372, partial [uncultured Solirubrobacteraceae bacterium]
GRRALRARLPRGTRRAGAPLPGPRARPGRSDRWRHAPADAGPHRRRALARLRCRAGGPRPRLPVARPGGVGQIQAAGGDRFLSRGQRQHRREAVRAPAVPARRGHGHRPIRRRPCGSGEHLGAEPAASGGRRRLARRARRCDRRARVRPAGTARGEAAHRGRRVAAQRRPPALGQYGPEALRLHPVRRRRRCRTPVRRCRHPQPCDRRLVVRHAALQAVLQGRGRRGGADRV